MAESQDFQVQYDGTAWILRLGDVVVKASDIKDRNGKIAARLVIDTPDGNAFTDTVTLTNLSDRKRVLRNLPNPPVVTEGALRALESAIRKGAASHAPSDDPSGTTKRKAQILDDAPDVLSRPLSLVAGQAYAATWVHLDTGNRALVIMREDGALFADGDVPIEGAESVDALDMQIRLTEPMSPRHGWSGRGVNHYKLGRRPDPAVVFQQLIRLITHHLLFVRSLGDQQAMAELLACYVLHSWLLDAGNVGAYVWFIGERGAGKSWGLKMVCQLSFGGQELLAGSTLATLRDLSDAGAVLGLDDAENVTDPDKFDENKRALFLSGNRRGATVAVKEPAPSGKGWENRYVNVFGPRVFSSIRTPDATLASRCIQVPMCRADREMPDPMDESQWPIPRREVIDSLWALALSSLRRVSERNREVGKHTELVGRNLDPWRGPLGVAIWLEKDCGVDGLVDRMAQLLSSYQREREDLEADDPVRLAVRCLGGMLADHNEPGPLVFKTAELTDRMNTLGKELDAIEDGREIKVTRVGRLLGRLRLKRPPNLPGKRRWLITRPFYESLAAAHGVNGHNDPAQSPAATVLVPDDPMLPVLDSEEF